MPKRFYLPFRSQCGKRRFETREDANLGRKELQRVYGRKFTVYTCETCGGYHLATKQNGINFRKRK